MGRGCSSQKRARPRPPADPAVGCRTCISGLTGSIHRRRLAAMPADASGVPSSDPAADTGVDGEATLSARIDPAPEPPTDPGPIAPPEPAPLPPAPPAPPALPAPRASPAPPEPAPSPPAPPVPAPSPPAAAPETPAPPPQVVPAPMLAPRTDPVPAPVLPRQTSVAAPLLPPAAVVPPAPTPATQQVVVMPASPASPAAVPPPRSPTWSGRARVPGAAPPGVRSAAPAQPTQPISRYGYSPATLVTPAVRSPNPTRRRPGRVRRFFGALSALLLLLAVPVVSAYVAYKLASGENPFEWPPSMDLSRVF